MFDVVGGDVITVQDHFIKDVPILFVDFNLRNDILQIVI